MTSDDSCCEQARSQSKPLPPEAMTVNGEDSAGPYKAKSTAVCWRAQIELALSDGRFMDAAGLFQQQATAADPGDTLAASRHFSNASAMFLRASDVKSALVAAQRSTDLCPDSVKGNYRAGEAHMKLRQFAEAVRSFEHALALAESQNESGIAAEINEALGNAMEAKRLAEEILEAQEDFLAASQETKTEGSVEEMHAKRMEEETDPVSTQTLNAGLAHFKEGRLEEGREMFQQAIAADNFNFQAYLHLGVVKMALGEMNSAQRNLEMCIQREPTCVPAYLVAGLGYESIGQLAKAAEIYQKLFGIANHISAGWTPLTSLMYKQGQAKAACGLLAEAAKIDTNKEKGIDVQSDGMIALYSGFFLAARGRLAEASTMLTMHFEQVPLGQPLARLALSEVHYRAGDHTAALAAARFLESIIDKLPTRVIIQAANWMNDHLDFPIWGSYSPPGSLKTVFAGDKQEDESTLCTTTPAQTLDGDHQHWTAGKQLPLQSSHNADSKPMPQPLGGPLAVYFVLPDEREGLLDYVRRREGGDSSLRYWTFKRTIPRGHFDMAGKDQGFDIHIVPEGALLAEGNEVALQGLTEEGAIEVQPYAQSSAESGGKLFVQCGTLCVQTVRLFCAVFQMRPALVYVSTDALCFTAVVSEIQDAQSRSVGGAAVVKTVVHSLADLEGYVIQQEEDAGNSAALSWKTVWDNMTSVARTTMQRILIKAGDKVGDIRASTHQKLRVPKVVALDFSIDEEGNAELLRFNPYPALLMGEDHVAHGVINTLLLSTWKLALSQASVFKHEEACATRREELHAEAMQGMRLLIG